MRDDFSELSKTRLEWMLSATKSRLEECASKLETHPLRSAAVLMPLARASRDARKSAYQINVGDEFEHRELVIRIGPNPIRSALKRIAQRLDGVEALWNQAKEHVRYGFRAQGEADRIGEPFGPKDVRKVHAQIISAELQLDKAFELPDLISSNTTGGRNYGVIDHGAEVRLGEAYGRREEQSSNSSGRPNPKVGYVEVALPRSAASIDEGLALPGSQGQQDVISSSKYLESRRFPVWFGTNREVTETGGFGEFEDRLSLGYCEVFVPKSHKFGSVGSTWIMRTIAKVRGRKDDRLVIEKTERRTVAEFQNSISAQVQTLPTRTALIIVHGYRVPFEEAIRRSAQIGFDLRIDGVTACFCWPSAGRLVRYFGDEEESQVSELHLLEFVKEIARNGDLEEIHILAHSMGNRVLRGAMERIADAYEKKEIRTPVGQIVLCAADVWTSSFLQSVQHYSRVANRRLTSYSCKQDVPLFGSKFVHQHARVGKEPPVFCCPNVDSVSASDLDLHALGHSYYAETEALLYDLADLVHNDNPPSKRIRLEPAGVPPGQYWEFRK